ncbi:unnamed protein product, partial [Brassica oleracea var. botrytis]
YAGVTEHNTDVVYVGMVFKNRNEFKQHMAIYAIQNKFRFRTTRSAPEGMVLKLSVNPPASKRPPGRPRKTRFLSRGEFQRGGPRKRTMCSRCKCTGHNRATCKTTI